MKDKSALWINAGLLEYRQALALQQQLVEQRIGGETTQDVVLALEHPPVFTLGSRGGLESLKVGRTVIEQQGIRIVETGRGGVITYHGPGQLILYPIVDLQGLGLKVGAFVDQLEELMLRLCGDFDIAANRDDRNRGVWVGDAKLGSLGIRVRKSICFHGLALNVSTDLAPFHWIDPCGLSGVSMTSFEQLTGKSISIQDVIQKTKKHYAELFGQTIKTADISDVIPDQQEAIP